MCTLIILLCSAFDFWITKNITGRLLVSLRWWTQDTEMGKQRWIFECRKHETNTSKVDSTFFWGSQFLATCFWLLFSFINVIYIDIYWLMVTGYSLLMTGTNLYAYYQCSRGESFHVPICNFVCRVESNHWQYDQKGKLEHSDEAVLVEIR